MQQNENECTCGEVHDVEATNKLTKYIWENLRAYSKEVPLDRHTMANAFVQVCSYLCVVHSPQNTNGQIEEIENFCRSLKETALYEAKAMQ